MNSENPIKILNGRNELGAGQAFPITDAYMQMSGTLKAGTSATVVIEETDNAVSGPWTAVGVSFALDTVGQVLDTGWFAFTKKWVRGNTTALSAGAVIDVALGR